MIIAIYGLRTAGRLLHTLPLATLLLDTLPLDTLPLAALLVDKQQVVEVTKTAIEKVEPGHPCTAPAEMLLSEAPPLTSCGSFVEREPTAGLKPPSPTQQRYHTH